MKDITISPSDNSTMYMVTFVQATEAYLSQPDIRREWEVSRLRRYFCNIVDQLFALLPKDSDGIVDPLMRVRLYRLCEEWCPYGASPAYQTQYEYMHSAAPNGYRDIEDKKQATERFQKESAMLAPAAAAAMASVCVSI